MDFQLDQKHEMARRLFQEFAENEVKPNAIEVDEDERFPRENIEKMAKYGFLGIPFDRKYGGQGCDPLTYVMCVEELAKVCGTTAVALSAHTSLCADPIAQFGTEEQKQKYLIPLAKGEKLGAFGLTEPGAGTDAQGVQTKAVLDGDEWVLNGSKCFITNGKEADIYIIIAYTDIVENKQTSTSSSPTPMSWRMPREERRSCSLPSSLKREHQASPSAPRRRRWVSAVLQPMS